MNKTLGIRAPEGKLYSLMIFLFFFYSLMSADSLTVVTVGILVKNANSVIVAEDVVLCCWAAVLPSSLDEVLSVAVALSCPLLEHLHCLVVTLGANGVLVCGEHDAGSVNLQPRKQKRVSATYI